MAQQTAALNDMKGLTECCVLPKQDGWVAGFRVQELCEGRGDRPGLSVLMTRTVSVDVKQH